MNTPNTDGGPAFPWTYMDRDSMGVEVTREQGTGMTLRQYAAIKLKVADSGSDWLDAMIEKSRRDDFAAAALQGIISSFANDSIISAFNKEADALSLTTPQMMARMAYASSDAMLAARGKEEA